MYTQPGDHYSRTKRANFFPAVGDYAGFRFIKKARPSASRELQYQHISAPLRRAGEEYRFASRSSSPENPPFAAEYYAFRGARGLDLAAAAACASL